MRLSIGQKLSAIVATTVFVMVGLSVFLLLRFNQAHDALTSMYEQDFRDTSLIGQIDGLLTRSDINMLRMIAMGDPNSIARWKQENNDHFATADRLIDELASHSDKAQLAQIQSLQDAYKKMRNGMMHPIERTEGGDIKGGPDANRLEVKENANRVFSILANLKDQKQQTAQNRFDEQEGAAAATRLVSIAVVAVTSIVVATLAVFFSRSLLNQLGGEPEYATLVTSEVAKGNLSIAVNVKPRDSSSLLYGLAAMKSQLVSIVTDIKSSCETIANASSEIASGNVDLSSRTEEQAASLEETAASMTQLTETVKQNTDNAHEANALATKATDMADTGNEAVQAMVETIGKISSSSSKISEITGVIEGIAFQTNILALNAAVEAARAGEQGRGFAVVASEVRSLAQRSASAAKEIKELIGSSVAMIQDGAQQASEAGATMEQVKLAIKQVSNIVGEIAAASEEQSRGIEQVDQAIGQMDEVTQQNAALVEQAAAAAQSLEAEAIKLQKAVSMFNIADLTQSAARVAIPQRKPRPSTPRLPEKRRMESAKPRSIPVTIADKSTVPTGNATKADWEVF
jgi:methyl-accepting chemotaxis protein